MKTAKDIIFNHKRIEEFLNRYGNLHDSTSSFEAFCKFYDLDRKNKDLKDLYINTYTNFPLWWNYIEDPIHGNPYGVMEIVSIELIEFPIIKMSRHDIRKLLKHSFGSSTYFSDDFMGLIGSDQTEEEKFPYRIRSRIQVKSFEEAIKRVKENESWNEYDEEYYEVDEEDDDKE